MYLYFKSFLHTDMSQVNELKFLSRKTMSYLSEGDNTVAANDLATQTAKWSGPLFIKQKDVLLTNLAKSRSREIECYNNPIALTFDRNLGSAAAEVPGKFQSDCKSLNSNLAASRLHEILRHDVRPFSE